MRTNSSRPGVGEYREKAHISVRLSVEAHHNVSTRESESVCPYSRRGEAAREGTLRPSLESAVTY